MTIARIGFAYNPTNEAAVELSERAAGWCRIRGIDHWASQAQDFDALVAELPKTDILVVLGGDGTFLRAARAVTEVDVPLLGINLGKVGFLSKAEATELEAVLGKLVAGEFTIDERMALEARILPAGREGSGPPHHALNDVVVARGALARVCRLDVAIGRRTSRRSSPTASSSPARPARPATRSAPAARSSTRSAGTSS